jgi:hypothetical protein
MDAISAVFTTGGVPLRGGLECWMTNCSRWSFLCEVACDALQARRNSIRKSCPLLRSVSDIVKIVRSTSASNESFGGIGGSIVFAGWLGIGGDAVADLGEKGELGRLPVVDVGPRGLGDCIPCK